MSKLIKRMFLFFPLLIIIILVSIPAYITGELRDIDYAISKQRNARDNMLLGFAYTNQSSYMKLANTEYYRPRVLALGTSRVMQFKEFLWNDTYYCAGGSVSHINEFVGFLENLSDDSLPEILIIGLDSYFFNENFNMVSRNQSHDIAKKEKPYGNIVYRSFLDYFQGKWTIRGLLEGSGNLGFSGWFKNSGFMRDGSYYYGSIYADPSSDKDFMFADTLTRIEKGVARFEYAQDVASRELDYLNNLLTWCAGHNIYVVGFIPPYAPTICDAMYNHNDDYTYLNKIFPLCNQLFLQYGFELYDYTDIRTLGCDDSYFIDGFHGGEVAYSIMTLDMVKQESILAKFVNTELIQEMINNRKNNLIFK